MLGKVAAGNRFRVVGCDENQPTGANPAASDSGTAGRMVNHLERRKLQRPFEMRTGFIEVTNDKVNVMNRGRRHVSKSGRRASREAAGLR